MKGGIFFQLCSIPLLRLSCRKNIVVFFFLILLIYLFIYLQSALWSPRMTNQTKEAFITLTRSLLEKERAAEIEETRYFIHDCRSHCSII